MSKRVCIIDVPGLGREMLGHVPGRSVLGQWLGGRRVAGLTPSWPAVTCSVQATLTTGVGPSEHGIIGNGLANFRNTSDRQYIDESSFVDYRRDVSFWEQSNQLLDVPRFWQKEGLKTGMLFFQQSMPGFGGNPRAAADVVLTPKPEHGADGKLTSLCWSQPVELVGRLFAELGPFPLMNYWGPLAGLPASAWIVAAAARVWREQEVALQWVYVPHLDYDLQRYGPDSAQAGRAVADLVPLLDELIGVVHEGGGAVMLLSEYAMHSVTRGIRVNARLREEGWLVTRASADGPLVDYGLSRAFAMVDHQIAHVYLRDEGDRAAAAKLLSEIGAEVLEPRPIAHARAGDLQVQAPADAWFDCRWWAAGASGAEVPTFARAVDIHRKPGYDPLELFWEPAAGGIAQDERLVRGSHGRVNEGEGILACDGIEVAEKLGAADVAGVIERVIRA